MKHNCKNCWERAERIDTLLKQQITEIKRLPWWRRLLNRF